MRARIPFYVTLFGDVVLACFSGRRVTIFRDHKSLE